MGTYRQYCPIARASEILAEAVNPLTARSSRCFADRQGRADDVALDDHRSD